MTDDKKKVSTEQTKTDAEVDKNEEILSEDELDAVSGGSAGEWCRTIRQGNV